MIYRQLIEDLTEWSRCGNRKPLVLRGARQVGKTTLVDEFSKQYDCYIFPSNARRAKDICSKLISMKFL